jgi:hypothetical protein
MGVDMVKDKKVNLTSTWACQRVRYCVKMAVAKVACEEQKLENRWSSA